MIQPGVLGLDFGDRDLYAVYLSGERFDGLVEPAASRGPVIYFDPTASISQLGVGFPSVTRSIGSGMSLVMGNRQVTTEDLVQDNLAGLYKGLWGRVEPGGRLVAAVPGAFSDNRRRLLLGIAQRTGFASPALIDRCTAAAIGYRGIDDGKAKPQTLLVYHCDYTDCEFAIVRLARGRCRILGAGIQNGLSGERLDAIVIEEIVVGLREQGIVLGLRSYTGAQWLELRRRAQQIRLALVRRERAIMDLPPSLTLAEGEVRFELRRPEFVERVKPLVRASLEAVETSLENAGLAIDAVDSVLTIGEVAINPPVSELLRDRFGREPIKGGRDLIARGAAIHAQEINLGDDEGAEATVVATLASVDTAPSANAETVTEPAPRRRAVSVLSVGAGHQSMAPGVEATEGDPWLRPIRDLINQRRHEEAEALISNYEEQLRTLRGSLIATTLPSTEEIVNTADAMLASGRYSEAVALSHQAWQTAPSSAEVFADMIRIHREAGLALNRMDQFADAMEILRCAHRHDQTDRSIHRAMAERLHLHAGALSERGQRDEARKCVEEALVFAPNHKGAQELLDHLSK